MGWFEDTVSSVSNAVGDAVSFVGETAAAPFRFANDLATGQDPFENVKNLGKQAIGAGIGGVGLAPLMAPVVKQVSGNEFVKKYTGDWLSDYGTTLDVSNKLAGRKDVTQQEWNSVARTGVRGAAIATGVGAVGAAGEAASAAAATGWSLPSFGTVLTGAGSAATAYGAVKGGNNSGAAAALGLPDWLSNLIPNSTPASSTPAGISRSSNGVSGQSGNYTTTSPSNSSSSMNSTLLIAASAAAAVGLAYVVAKRK